MGVCTESQRRHRERRCPALSHECPQITGADHDVAGPSDRKSVRTRAIRLVRTVLENTIHQDRLNKGQTLEDANTFTLDTSAIEIVHLLQSKNLSRSLLLMLRAN